MLIAIDGTGSREWRRTDGSNSHVAQFLREYRGNKPSLDDTHGPNTLGLDVGAIFRRATVHALVGYNGGERVFDIVGHSRGGHIAILVARELMEKRFEGSRVRFLGLFDAVDRSPSPWSAVIPTVVENCWHAVRNPLTLNRTWFGNTGRVSYSARYHEKLFWASHGAIGGDPASSWSFGGLTGPNSLLTPPTIDSSGAESVWTWMRAGALLSGVPIRGAN